MKKKRVAGTFFLVGLLLSSTAPWAAEGDCDGSGEIDDLDQDTLLSALNTPVEQSSLTNCDYDADGVIGMDDVAAHLSTKK